MLSTANEDTVKIEVDLSKITTTLSYLISIATVPQKPSQDDDDYTVLVKIGDEVIKDEIKIKKGARPRVKEAIQPDALTLKVTKNDIKLIPVIVGKDSTRVGMLTFKGDTIGASTNDYASRYSGGLNKSNLYEVGWRKAEVEGSSEPTQSEQSLPTVDSKFFKALDDKTFYLYGYKYVTSDACKLDTTLYIAVWVKKDYIPEFGRNVDNRFVTRGENDNCKVQYVIDSLPYIKDVVETGGTYIDTIQIDSVARTIIVNGQEIKTDTLAYHSGWKSGAADTLLLDEGNSYEVVYRFRYKYAHPDSIAVSDTIRFGVPYSIITLADVDTIFTGTLKDISVLKNDTVGIGVAGGCGGFVPPPLTLKVDSAYGAATYRDSGFTSRGGKIVVKKDDTKSDSLYVEYISAPDYQGLDTFFYRVATVSGNVDADTFKIDTVVVRVEPVYALLVTKTVDSVANRKGVVRRAGTTNPDPNLDSIFVGDTVYFKIKVYNIGKNSIADSTIFVRDTFPPTMGKLDVPSGAAEIASPAIGYKWEISGTTGLACNDSAEFTYRLVARDTAIAIPDANKVRAAVTLPPNSFDNPPPPDTTIAASDTLLLSIYESIDVSFTQRIDTAGGTTDALTCDSLYQPVKFLLTATNAGSSPLHSVEITSKLPAGMRLDSATFNLVTKTDTTPFDAGSTPSSTGNGDTTYTWHLSRRIGPDSALQVVVYASVGGVDTFRIASNAFEGSGKADVDSADNGDGKRLVVIFQPEIKLTVEKWAKKDPINGTYIGQGSTVEYNIAVTNNSLLPLRGVEVRDTLFKTYLKPDDQRNGSLPEASDGRLVWDAANGDSSFVWTIPYLGVGADNKADTLSFYVTANEMTPADENGNPTDSVKNTAYAYLPLYYGKDSVVGLDSVKIIIQEGVNLVLHASIDPPQGQRQNDTVRLKIVITNVSSNNEGVSKDITVKINFNEDSLKWIDSALTVNSTYDPTGNIWTILVPSGGNPPYSLDAGRSDSITLTLLAREKTGETKLGGYIVSSPYKSVDGDTVYAALQVVENPVDLRVEKKAAQAPIYLANGEATIRDTITLFSSKSAIGNITLTDTLPDGIASGCIEVTSLQGVVLSQGTDYGITNGKILKWGPVSLLSPPQDTIIIVTYKVNNPGQYISVAYARCDSIEATWSNNAALSAVEVRARTSLKAELKVKVLHPQLGAPTGVLEGDTIVYTLVASHTTESDTTAENVTLAFAPSIVTTDSTVFISARHGSDVKTDASKGIIFSGINIPGKEGEGADSIVMLVRVKPNASAVNSSDSIRCTGYLVCSNDVNFEDDTARFALKALRNEVDLSISVTPVDTFFYLSDAQGAVRTPGFTYSITVRNTRSAAVTVNNVSILYRVPFGFGSLAPGDVNITTKQGYNDGSSMEVWQWDLGNATFENSNSYDITISNRNIPYDKAGKYESYFTVSAGELEADPVNNAVAATAKAGYDVDLSVDSIWLFNKNDSATYRQGDTIGVRVRLSNKHGREDGENVKVSVVNPDGFTAVEKTLPHELLDNLAAKTGVLYDTLWFAIDTFTTVSGGPLRLRVAASADDVSLNPHTSPVTDSVWSAWFSVAKGADARVWVEKVEHAPPYYSNLSYTIAVANFGQYRATEVTLYHALPDTFAVDSVRIKTSNMNAMLLPQSYPNLAAGDGWRLGTVDVNTDTARITLYVTSDSAPATLPIAGYIACANDYNASNDTIGRFDSADSLRLKVAKNPYHLRLTKTAAGPYSSITDTIAYTLVLANVGDSTAYSVRITDTIPEGLRLLDYAFQQPDTAYYGAVDSAFMVWSIASINPNVNDTLIIRYLPYEAGPIVNKAQIVSVDVTNHPFDPDAKNRRDHACVDTVKVHSAQQISITIATVNLTTGGTSTASFTQGDTVRITVKVEKTLPEEKALGIKITADTASFGDRLNFYSYDTANVCQLEDSKFDFDSFVWTLNLDTCPDASGELQLYAVVGPNAPDKDTFLDSLAVRFNVERSNEYYPMRTTAPVDSVKIYVAYCDFDLEVKVEAEHRAVYEGVPFDYNIYVKNLRGALNAADVVTLVDTLPLGVTFEGTFPVAYDHIDTLADGRLALRWDNLTAYLDGVKEGEYRQLVVQNCTGGSAGSNLISRAQVMSSRHEADLTNNSSADTIFVRNPHGDVELTFESASGDTVQGSMVELRITITSHSSRPLSDLRIATDPIPKHLRFISSDNGGEYSSETQEFSWKNNEQSWFLQPDSSRTITLVVQAVDTGRAAWEAALYVDGNKAAVDTVSLYVKKNPYNVTLTKTASQNVFYKEDDQPPFGVTYSIAVKNTGDSTLTGVEVRDTLPAGINYLNASPSTATETYGDGNGNLRTIVIFSVASLAKDVEESLSVSCEIADETAVASSPPNRAYVTCDQPEAVTTDNTDTATVEVRNLINLKVQVALCGADSVEYPGDHKFRQGDEFYVKVSVTNNGKDPTATQTSVSLSLRYADGVGVDTSYSYTFGMIINSANVKIFKVRSEKAGFFGISAVASTTGESSNPIAIRDSAAVSGSMLPGADMQVKIAPQPPANNYTSSRRYTISLENIGQFRADTVILHHRLDEQIVSLDDIEMRQLGSSMLSYYNVSQSLNETLNGATQEVIRYDKADREFIYSVNAVEVGGSASITLVVTTATPTEDSVLQIWPEASVDVLGDDFYWGNNQARSETPMVVEPNPYNVSVKISPRKTDMRNTSGAPATPEEYTITAANIGKYPAGDVAVYFDTHASLKIAGEDSSKSKSWPIPQLRKGEKPEFRVSVEAENLSSKGSLASIARIEVGEPVFRQHEADTANNADTAYLHLFSVLDSWPIMEAFSPNGDGKNDKFVIRDLESDLVDKAELVIVSRYGSEVYYHANYKEAQLGDAAFTGAGLPEGAYFYRLTVHFGDGSSDKRGGVITVRRSRWK